MNIYVGNIPYNISEQDLEDQFSEFGTVTSVKIVLDRDTGRSKGFGFVEMEDEEAGKEAISELNDAEISGRRLKVNEARPRSNNNRGGGGGYGGGGGGGGYGGGGGGGGGYNRGGRY